MIYNIYAIRDDLTGFMTPTVDLNDQSAVRNFRHGVMATRDILHTHPQDFVLYCLGSFDTETGQIVPESPGPRQILRGSKEVADA